MPLRGLASQVRLSSIILQKPKTQCYKTSIPASSKERVEFSNVCSAINFLASSNFSFLQLSTASDRTRMGKL